MNKQLMQIIAADMREAQHTAYPTHYSPFLSEVANQFRRLKDDINVIVTDKDPYSSPESMFADIQFSNTLRIWSGGQSFQEQHPMAILSEFKDARGRRMIWNEVFRAVHDFFGHFVPRPRNDFTLTGEVAAYKAHKAMFRPESIPALYAETIGSLCQYFVDGEFVDTQKAVLIPVRF